MFKLPSAYFCGVRTKFLDSNKCIVTVKYRWINQNPFKSLYWAVQGMAAELTTGALVMKKVQESGKPISMLIAKNNASYSKKATGRIKFECVDGHKIEQSINKAIETGEAQSIWMNAKGVNSEGIEVSDFNFEWTIKLRSK